MPWENELLERQERLRLDGEPIWDLRPRGQVTTLELLFLPLLTTFTLDLLRTRTGCHFVLQ